MNSDSAIDLSLRPRSSSGSDQDNTDNVPIVRPIPRPAWSIIWYQNLWSSISGQSNTAGGGNNGGGGVSSNRSCTVSSDAPLLSQNENQQNHLHRDGSEYERIHSSVNDNDNNESSHSQSDQEHEVRLPKKIWRKRSSSSFTCCPKMVQGSHHSLHNQHNNTIQRSPKFETDCGHDGDNMEHPMHKDGDSEMDKLDPERTQLTTVVDIACCDGPVRFERISNPNFALTVEHQNVPSSSSNSTIPEPTCRTVTAKTYLCIYCNQSFKSLFCYQKHKKRHLNPVSVDITGTHVNTPMVCAPESKSKTKDLNVQFFPCKKCGCKFPSYYFVHKHKKTCH